MEHLPCICTVKLTRVENGKTRLKLCEIPISTNVDITVYQHGKNALHFFYI